MQRVLPAVFEPNINHQYAAVWNFNMCHINCSADEVEFSAGKVWFDCYDIIKIYLKLECVSMTKLELMKGLC